MAAILVGMDDFDLGQNCPKHSERRAGALWTARAASNTLERESDRILMEC
jgi:hypothetical protein